MTKKNRKLVNAYARRLVRIATNASGKTWKRGERYAAIRALGAFVLLTVG